MKKDKLVSLVEYSSIAGAFHSYYEAPNSTCFLSSLYRAELKLPLSSFKLIDLTQTTTSCCEYRYQHGKIYLCMLEARLLRISACLLFSSDTRLCII